MRRLQEWLKSSGTEEENGLRGREFNGGEQGRGWTRGGEKRNERERCGLRMGGDPSATSIPDPGAFVGTDPASVP
jgi:hypothetical protein